MPATNTFIALLPGVNVGGAGRTKLTLDYLERTLGVRGTQRNWKTLLKLIELSRR